MNVSIRIIVSIPRDSSLGSCQSWVELKIRGCNYLPPSYYFAEHKTPPGKFFEEKSVLYRTGAVLSSNFLSFEPVWLVLIKLELPVGFAFLDLEPVEPASLNPNK